MIDSRIIATKTRRKPYLTGIIRIFRMRSENMNNKGSFIINVICENSGMQVLFVGFYPDYPEYPC